MKSTDYESQILGAIEILANNAVNNAKYDKTIQATIIESLDSTIGKYLVKYQDSEFEVFNNNTDIYYTPGTLVNILIPNGDFTLTKNIIDAVDKNQVEYTPFLEEEDKYKNTTGNIIDTSRKFELCSYKTLDTCVLYDRDTDQNNINLDTLYIKNNILDKDNILCGVEFKTDLDKAQQQDGNYGIVFELEFMNSSTQEIVVKSFVLDANHMSGNPYNLSTYTRQYQIFKIDAENFIDIKSIYLFCKNFPQTDDEKPNDIFAKNFEFSLLNQIDTEDENSYELLININSNKKYFDDYDSPSKKINMSAELLYKNQVLEDEFIDFYWFKENGRVYNSSEEYSSIGGPGWECLNEYNVTENGKEYVPSNNVTFIKSDLLTKDNNIKCVAIKSNRTIATNTITLFNYSAQYKLTIESSEGELFYFDNGCPTLKCLINGTISDEEYTYQWGYIDSDNIYHKLDETTMENEIYNITLAKYNDLMDRIETGLAMNASSQEEIDEYLAILNAKNQRVEGNAIYDVDLTKIIDKAIFKCSVLQSENILLGTASLKITNSKETEGMYNINIVNGIQTFHYTVNGIAPTNDSLSNPITLQPLSYILYDNNGKIITGDALNSCKAQWIVPKENTLIIAKDSTDSILHYDLVKNYDENKLYNNNIELTVIYKGMTLKANTTFTFTKDGEPGINGTDIVCKIVPNDIVDENYKYNCYPMIVNGKFNFGCFNYERSDTYDLYATDKWFKVELWRNGQVFLNLVDSTNDVNVKWSMLRNRYNSLKSDTTSIEITSDENGYHFRDLGYKESGANIVKVEVTYDNIIYYATLPIITVETFFKDKNYSIQLKKDTGFRFVKYGEDGRLPLYSNNIPFTILVNEDIDGFTEDISTINNEHILSYIWNKRGKIYNYENEGFVNDYDFTIIEDSKLARNQKFLKPNDQYDGLNVSNALEVKIQNMDEEEIGKIHIPLYFYLDRYGHAALNSWDGNSISLNEDGGVILAPQIGAGHKEIDNSFTGLLIGSVKEENSDTIESGLLGYYYGQRTLFLNAYTGRAEFGRIGDGQIILSPGEGLDENNYKAMIYGGNYVEQTPSHEGSGLLIDLTQPEIRFGNEQFVVDKDGNLNAKGVTLRGEIQALSGTFGNGSNKIKIGNSPSSNYSFIYSGDKVNLDAKANGFYLGTNGIALGSPGENETESPFKVSIDGILTAKKAIIKGEINAISGSIGNWYINSGSIKYANQDDFYLKNDGSVKFGNFSVSTNGNVQAESMQITGGQFNRGSIILEGSSEEAKNGLIVGIFDFANSSTFTNARNCVGKDSIISRGSGAASNFSFTKIAPGNVKISNAGSTKMFEIDTVTSSNYSAKFKVDDNNSYIGIYKDSAWKTYMSAAGMWSAAYNNTSLESKKKNISLDNGCLNQILNTDIVNFNWKFEDDTDKKHVGLIIPDQGGNYKYADKVITHDEDAVDLYSAVMMSWKAIQELQDQINEIKGDK